MDEKNEKLPFSVIEFGSSNKSYISAVPTLWVTEDKDTKGLFFVRWPKNKANLRSCIVKSIKPEPDWLYLQNVTIIGRYATYGEALSKEQRLSKTDVSNSEDEVVRKRKRKINKKYQNENYIPHPPKLKRRTISQASTSSSDSSTSTEEDVTEAKNITEKQPAKSENISKYYKICDSVRSNKELCEKIIMTKFANPNDTDAHVEINSVEEANEILNVAPAGEETYNLENEITAVNEILGESVNIPKTSTAIDNEVLNKIFKSLAEIKASLAIFNQHLRLIHSKLHINIDLLSEADDDNVLPELPLKNLDEIKTLERVITTSKTAERQLILKLKFVGGTSAKNFIVRCLERLFSNEAGQQCSWTGKKQNYKLRDLTFMNIIKETAKKLFPEITEKIFEQNVMAWFQHAKTRARRAKQT